MVRKNADPPHIENAPGQRGPGANSIFPVGTYFNINICFDWLWPSTERR